MGRGQVTVFLIVGLILIVAVSMMYLVSTEKKRALESPINEVENFAQPVYSYIDQCMQTSAEFSTTVVAIQGGYFDPPSKFTSLTVYDIPTYYDPIDGSMVPDKELVEQQLAVALSAALESCTANYTVFDGFDITVTGLDTKAILTDSRVIFEAEYDMSIAKGSRQTTLGSFRRSQDSNIGRHLEIAEQVVSAHHDLPDHVRLTSLMDIGYDNDVVFNTLYLNNTVVYMITDNNDFGFAIDYNWTDPANTEIRIEAYAGYPVEYEFSDPGEYSDLSGLFDITGAGIIVFTPDYTDAGLHESIVVREHKGVKRYISMLINITSENSAPILDNNPDYTVNRSIDPIFNITINASDPDGDQLFYNIISPFEDMKINTLTGQLVYNTTNIFPTVYTISAVATDIKGATDTKSFNLVIK